MPPPALACVSFLNSKPLIAPLLARPEVQVRFAVPAQLLELVESGQCAAGLLPVVDYQHSRRELVLVPAGAIACDGPTLTVRIYSQVPPERITTLYGDTDSHTSIILAQVILRERYGIAPPLLPLALREGDHHGRHETMLLIGDKVINAAPQESAYRYQLDLGEEWKKLTGLPFVFACWMMPADMPPAAGQQLADLLAWSQREGAKMTEALLDRYAAGAGWPRDLARQYFTAYMQYEVTARGRQGLARFFELSGKHGLLHVRRETRYWELTADLHPRP